VTPRKLVILPTYNEAPNVLDLSREVLAAADTIDVLVVDDNSPDGTGDLVARAAQTESRLRLLARPRKLGLGTAYLAGFRFALEHGYDCAITMDCDRSHNPRYLPAMLAAMERHDLVIGSRYAPGGGILNWPRHRVLLSAFANSYARVLLRLPIRDCTSGFRCYRRLVLETVDPWSVRSSGYSFLEEMAWRVYRCGFRIGEIPILFEQRVAGKSKIDSSEIYRAAWHVLATALRPPRLPHAQAPASVPRQVSSCDDRNVA
jgi:dolichol-phosphate mannosyltransferase